MDFSKQLWRRGLTPASPVGSTVASRRRVYLGTTALVAVTIAVLASADRAEAQNFTWGGAGSTTSSTDYNLGSNWSNPPAGAPPISAGQAATFSASGSSSVSVTAGPIVPDSWTFSTNAQAYVITGSEVDFSTATGVQNNSANAVSIGNVLGGVGAVTQAGAATLTLSGNNTYTGGTFLKAGTLALANSQAL